MTEAEAEGSAEVAERMNQVLNDAALALMVSVGHRTGLFDVMAVMPAATSAEIAARAALDQRYVAGMAGGDDRRENHRSWLAAKG